MTACSTTDCQQLDLVVKGTTKLRLRKVLIDADLPTVTALFQRLPIDNLQIIVR